MITQDYLKSRLEYDALTGVFTWKSRPGNSRTTKSWNTRYAGKVAGYEHKHNDDLSYWYMSFDNHPYRAHRLAWLYSHGEYVDRVDHIDGNGLNNKLENLRTISHSSNIRKGRIQKNNTSGYKGVFWRKDTRRWAARAKVDGKYKSLGSYDTKEEAFAVYCEAVLQQTGEIYVDLISKEV